MKTSRLIIAALLLALSPAAAITLRAEEGDKEPGLVRCANLVYGNNKTSKCFSDHFLTEVAQRTNIKTEKKFAAVKMESGELFEHPFAVMSGEGAFTLSDAQRENLREYLLRGGFLVASPGCSNRDWARSFTKEVQTIFTDVKLKPIAMDHPVFSTVFDIRRLVGSRASSKPQLLGLEIDGKIVLIYSPDGLNDTAHAGGNCCCCGGNEIRNAKEVNVNLLAYALTH